MMYFLTIGIVLGLSVGLAPGPLLALVISETLQHGIKSGIKIAVTPIITDLPIIILTSFVLAKLSNFYSVLGFISLIGGLSILWMSYQTFQTKKVQINHKKIKTTSFAKGILTNILNPHPYIFWFGTGAPILSRATSQSINLSLAFIIGFYICLIGSKVTLAILIGKTKFLLNSSTYILIMRFLGLVMCSLAITLFHDGLKLLKII
jgi:threonine/homoserine/homoserine lactone efflux protein